MKQVNTVENMEKVHNEIIEMTKNHVNQPEIIIYETRIERGIHGPTPEIVIRTNRGIFWFGYPVWNKEYDGTKFYVGMSTW